MNTSTKPSIHTLRLRRGWRPLLLGMVICLGALSGVVGLGTGVSAALTGTGPQATPIVTPTDDGDSSSVEVGMVFNSSQAGTVTGLRFYKPQGNTGTHVGTLWAGDGRALAKTTFAGESAQGWQSAQFARPVTIDANARYVVSYLAPHGHYAQIEGAFSGGKTLSLPPITGTAGVFAYGQGGFPRSTWHDSSYYVEPLLSGGTVPTAPPSTTTTRPTPSTTSTPPITPTTSRTTATSPATVTVTTPPPSSTGTPTSAPTTTTASTAPVGAFPDATNTGVPAGTTLTAGTGNVCGTVDRRLINGDLVLSCDSTVTNTRIIGRVATNGYRLTGSHLDIGPDACPSGTADYQMVTGPVALTAVHLHHGVGDDLVRLTGGGDTTISDSLLDRTCFYPGAHLDAAQFYDPGAVGKITLNHNTIDSRAVNSTDLGNAAIFLADNPGRGTVVTVTNSRLAGGNFTVSLYDALTGSGVFYDVRGNTFVKGSSQYGPCASSNSSPYNGTDGFRFTGNVFDDGSPATC